MFFCKIFNTKTRVLTVPVSDFETKPLKMHTCVRIRFHIQIILLIVLRNNILEISAIIV
jgi:hypothetical protein